MNKKIKHNDVYSNVVAKRLCFGCGACVLVCPEKALQTDLSKGIYLPVINRDRCINCGKCKILCPATGYGDGTRDIGEAQKQFLAEDCAGVWAGGAKEKELRIEASAGGVVTSIVKYALENERGYLLSLGLHLSIQHHRLLLIFLYQSNN